MTLLAIETATDMVGVGLLRDDGPAAERVHLGGRAHAELLVPAIEEVCAVSGTTVSDIDRLAVDIGPGLFTGLRVGVATAKALGQTLGIGVVGVSSLDVLAAAARDHADGGPARRVVAVVDARRGEVFAAAYSFDLVDPGTDPARVRDDRSEPLPPDDLVGWVRSLVAETGGVTLVGDGAARYRPLLSEVEGADLRLVGTLSGPPPLALAHLAAHRLADGAEPVASGDLVPDYRRAADARINWEQRDPVVPPSP